MINLSILAGIVANIVGGVSLLAAIIFACVAYLKQWGIKGKWLTGSAFIVGVVLAVLIRLALLPAQTFSDWVFTGLFGLVAGLVASGAYKGFQDAAGKNKTIPSVTLSTSFTGDAQSDPATDERLISVTGGSK